MHALNVCLLALLLVFYALAAPAAGGQRLPEGHPRALYPYGLSGYFAVPEILSRNARSFNDKRLDDDQYYNMNDRLEWNFNRL